MSIVDFIRARLDEDEQTARAATQGEWEWDDDGAGLGVLTEWRTCPHHCKVDPDAKHSRGISGQPGHEHRYMENAVVDAHGYDDPWLEVSEQDAAHIARFQPKRVLRQCAGLRRVFSEELDSHVHLEGAGQTIDHEEANESTIFRGLASVWSDHPDYRPEWAQG
ncbi:DUF6221 family protein [Nocardia nova]|uniref:DUF6221 family protein n=1 Tax=Nocardia nova TaxID=37330 RepID=UPI001893C231|nr:DUF6221 family protein [Nocardia nova]MBF6277043.1 hypothetical protein [Nocardia nova]